MKKAVLLTCVCFAFVIGLQTAEECKKSKSAAYVGAKKCKMCHKQQYTSWAESIHAKALETLKKGNKLDGKDHMADKDCLVCHATGYGQESGFVNETDTPNLIGVSCEACHGAAGDYYKSHRTGKYTKDEFKAAGGIVPDAETCKQCHNKKSPTYKEFTFDKTANVHVHVALKKPH